MIEPTDYTPTELFSPSGSRTARDCARSWAFRYIMGLKEPEVLWCDIHELGTRPEPKVKSKPTVEERKARKAWNKKYRPALGKEVHARIEQYYAHAETPCVVLPVDWSDVPGRVALAGLCHLPAPADCATVEVEASIAIDLSFLYLALGGEICKDPIVFRGKRDLLTIAHLAAENGEALSDEERYLLIDHKSTYTFDYIDREHTIKTVKTPEQLVNDEQANLYALDVMQRYSLTSLRCRWVYYRTEDGPAACAVDFTITLEGAQERVAQMVEQALELRALMRKRTSPNEVPGTIESCPKYGGCIHHPDQGGRCEPPVLTTGERLVKLSRDKAAAEAKRALLPKKTIADIARERAATKNKTIGNTPKARGQNSMALSFRDRAKATEASASAASAPASEQAQDEQNQVAADAAREEYEADQTIVDGGTVFTELQEGQTATTAGGSAHVSQTPEAVKERKARTPKPKTVGLGSTLAELAAQLQDNEAQHAELLASIRTAVGQ